jgi:hypothetical protein
VQLTVRLHGDLQLLNRHSNLKHNSNNNLHNRNHNSLNCRLNPSSSNSHNRRRRLSGLDLELACDPVLIILRARHPLAVRCGAVRVWVLVVLALELGLEVLGSLVLVLRIRRSGIRLLRITRFLRRHRARLCMDHRPRRIMERECFE